jgi:Ca2+-binding RTX toxin-like protein
VRSSLRSARVLSVATLVAAPLLFTPAAFGASSSTVVPLTCTSTFATIPGHIALDASVPDTVAAGSTFALDVTARDFFDIPAPYSGTLSVQLTFSATSGATPSGNFTVNAPPVHFDQGAFMPALGTFHEQFLASGSPGSTIAFSFVEFSYTIVPDPGPQSLDFVCTPTSTSPVIAQTLITAGCEGATPTIVGTPGDDVIRGTSGNDVIVGDAGTDTIQGFSGADRICGGDGHDTIDAGSGRDRVSGGADDDVIVGSSGDDQLAGDAGNDVLSGNSGHDVLDGGTDVGAPGDTCDGGSGIDTTVACEVVLATP